MSGAGIEGRGPAATAEALRRAIAAAPDAAVPTLRPLRRSASARLADLPGDDVLAACWRLLEPEPRVPRWIVYELVHHHAPTLARLDATTLLRLGRGIAAWGDVDPFACYLSGVAWREGRVQDELIHGWAASDDRWWRRAALVSTVPLNNRARGGSGEAARTLAACRLLEEDRDETVVKALSWALRELAKRDPESVAGYLTEASGRLAPRVRREVGRWLATGRKGG